MIVKVQLALESNIPGKNVPGDKMLVYNQSRSVMFEQDTDEGVKAKMKGRPKAYFHAKLLGPEHLEFGEEAPWQAW